jgi:hypothetical protein
LSKKQGEVLAFFMVKISLLKTTRFPPLLSLTVKKVTKKALHGIDGEASLTYYFILFSSVKLAKECV